MASENLALEVSVELRDFSTVFLDHLLLFFKMIHLIACTSHLDTTKNIYQTFISEELSKVDFPTKNIVYADLHNTEYKYGGNEK